MFTDQIDKLASTLVEMSISENEFHLTGSRYFSDYGKQDRDWDFFTECTVQVADWLKEHGFLEADTYLNPIHDCIGLWSLPHGSWTQDAWIGLDLFQRKAETLIDVQLVVNVERKLMIQQKLKTLYRIPSKTDWQVAFLMASNEPTPLLGETNALQI